MKFIFHTFDPVRSFDSEHFAEWPGFVANEGRPLFEDDAYFDDLLALWSIGEEAYHRLGIRDSENFVDRLSQYRESIDAFRSELLEAARSIGDDHGHSHALDSEFFFRLSRWEILDDGNFLFENAPSLNVNDSTRVEYSLFACLEQVDLSLLAIRARTTTAVASATAACEALNAVRITTFEKESRRKVRSELARNAALSRHRNSPQHLEKAFIKTCWREWNDFPSRYPSKARFALDMVNKCEYITSTKVIEDWTRKWERGED